MLSLKRTYPHPRQKVLRKCTHRWELKILVDLGTFLHSSVSLPSKETHSLKEARFLQRKFHAPLSIVRSSLDPSQISSTLECVPFRHPVNPEINSANVKAEVRRERR